MDIKIFLLFFISTFIPDAFAYVLNVDETKFHLVKVIFLTNKHPF
jgi:hypothetical protein